MFDTIIIGNGPAGVSASLYTARAGLKTLIIGTDNGALQKAEKIENFYGLEKTISGEELAFRGMEQAKKLGVEIILDQVVGMNYNGNHIIVTKNNEYNCKTVIIATGVGRKTVPIEGLNKLEGHGVSYCAVCDAFFYRGRDVAVLGAGEYAIHEALQLLPIVRSVTLLTNGEKMTLQVPEGITTLPHKITNIIGENVVEGIHFDNGNSITLSGVFVAIGIATSSDIARKVGIAVENNHILVNKDMMTNISGVFAAGDCTGGMYQIAKAVYDGAVAGSACVKLVRAL